MPLKGGLVRARGKNHAAWLLATALLAAPLATPRAQDGGVVSYTQRGVPAEATAENGVIARERALAAGRRAAWNRIAAAAGVDRPLSDAQIEAMVTSIIIEEEHVSPTRYAGRITVNFDPDLVRAALGAAGQGDAASPAAAGAVPGRPPPPVVPVATIEATAVYGSLQEWLELRRRLGGLARMEVVAISTDRARLRLGLRTAPGVAADDFARAGLALLPGSGAPGDSWRVSLAGRS